MLRPHRKVSLERLCVDKGIHLDEQQYFTKVKHSDEKMNLPHSISCVGSQFA